MTWKELAASDAKTAGGISPTALIKLSPPPGGEGEYAKSDYLMWQERQIAEPSSGAFRK